MMDLRGKSEEYEETREENILPPLPQSLANKPLEGEDLKSQLNELKSELRIEPPYYFQNQKKYHKSIIQFRKCKNYTYHY